MNAIGELTAAVMDIGTRDTILQFRVHGDVREEAEKLKGKEVDIKAKRHYEKRSLTSNGFYWSILTEIAKSLKISNACCHNMLLRKYGTPETIDGQTVYVVIPDGNDEQIMEAETYHLSPTTQVKQGNDGKAYRTYMLLRGSSQYDKQEMMRLIDGAVSDAKEMGIEVYDPDYERIKEQYGKENFKG